MIKRIKITGYKSIKNLEIELKPLTVLFGPNSAGKSNFLDALQLLSRIATSKTLKSAFEAPYRGTPLESYSFETGGTKELLTKNIVSFSIEVDVELSKSVVDYVNTQIRNMKIGDKTSSIETKNGRESTDKILPIVRERNLRYRVNIQLLPKLGILRVEDEYLTALTKDGQPTSARRPFLERNIETDKLHLRMEGQAHPTYFDRYLDHSILSSHLYMPHYPHMVALREELERWLFFYFEPRERMRTPNPVKEVRHIGLMGEELASFLNTLKALEPKKFRSLEKSLHMLIPSITGIDIEVNDLGEVELRLKEGETLIPSRLLSEGTLRILGLLALTGAKDIPSLIGLEEPENGIHPRRIQMVADLIKNWAEREYLQIIVTSHSPLFLKYIPDEYLFVCRKVEANTEIEPLSLWGSLVKKQAINQALESIEERLPIHDRILRGDFDA